MRLVMNGANTLTQFIKFLYQLVRDYVHQQFHGSNYWSVTITSSNLAQISSNYFTTNYFCTRQELIDHPCFFFPVCSVWSAVIGTTIIEWARGHAGDWLWTCKNVHVHL